MTIPIPAAGKARACSGSSYHSADAFYSLAERDEACAEIATLQRLLTSYRAARDLLKPQELEVAAFAVIEDPCWVDAIESVRHAIAERACRLADHG